MERAVALKKLRKLLGDQVGYRFNDKAPTRDERDIAKAELPGAIIERNKIKDQRDARYSAILAADADYQRLKTEYDVAREHVHRLADATTQQKITVGISNSMFFHVKAEGDSWEEIIDKLTKNN